MGEMLFGGMQIIIPDVNPREFPMNLNDIPRVKYILCLIFYQWMRQCLNYIYQNI